MRQSVKGGLVAIALTLCAVLALKGAVLIVQSGSWSQTGNLSSPRAGASAATLQDGRVLVTGGDPGNGAGPQASADFINTDGTISAAPPMNNPREGHVSVALQDGRVLVAGGLTVGGSATSAAEIFDPVANSWTSVGLGMIEARLGATAGLLPDGRVVVAGGQNGTLISSTIEVFDPSLGAFAAAAQTLSSPRTLHAMSVLQDGRVLIIGGFNGTAPLGSTDIFDPVAGTVSAGPSLAVARFRHSATTLLNGQVLVVGGNNGDTNPAAADLASAEIFDPTAGTFTTAPATLGTAREGHLAFLLPNNNNVLIAGGTSAGSAVASSELFSQWQGTFAATRTTVGTITTMTTARSGATGSPNQVNAPTSVLQRNGVLMVAGGNGANGNALNSTEAFGFSTVQTDKSDYAPGETVTITGSGWQPGEIVTLSLVEVPLIDTHGPFTVVADSAGNIFNNQFVPNALDVSVRFYLTATGSVSQAQTSFTDNKTVAIAFSSTGSGTVTSSGGNGTLNCTDTGGVASGNCSNGLFGNTDTVTLTATPTSPSTIGTWTVPAYTIVSGCTSGSTTCKFTMNNTSQTITVTFNPGPATKLVFAQQPTNTTAGSSITPAVTVKVEDAGGNLIGNSSASVTVALGNNPGGGTLSGTTTLSAVSGVTTFSNLSVNKTGTGYTLVATSGTLTQAISGAFNITSATPATLVVSGYPSPITAGSSNSFTVTAKDQFGNTATGYTGTVKFTSSDGQAVLPANYTFVAGDSGTRSFSATLKTAGTQSITATDTVTSSITGTQSGIQVNAATASTLVVSGYPSPVTAPSTSSFTVTAKDQFGNTATGYTGTVKFTSSDGQAVLPANYTFVAGDSGTHSFSATLKTGGIQSITATDTVTSSITGTQSGITVNQAPAITSVNSTTFTAGTAGSFTVTATGFPAPTFSETGTLPSGVTLTAAGVLSGSPAANTGGTYSITITASNGVSPNATQSFTLTVNQAPTITSAASTTFTVGTAGTFTVTASGFPAPTLSESGTLPSGVTFNVSTGVLSGTPAANTGGTYPITFTAANGVAPNATQAFTLTVNQAPAITSANNITFTVGTAGSFTVTASGFPAPTFSETGTLPTGVTLNATTGLLSGTPTVAGSFVITITANNGVTPNANQAFTLTVNPKLAFTTNAFGIVTGLCSSQATVQTQNNDGSGANQNPARTLNLSSNSGTGKFFSDAACSNQITSATIASGSSTASFFYSDTTSGSPTITVASTGLTSVQQAEVIDTLRFQAGPFSVQTNQCSTAVLIQSVNPSPDALTQSTTIALSSSSAGGKFYSDAACTTQITSTTIAPGINGGHDTNNFYYKDTTGGAPTLTASAGTASATQTESVVAPPAISKSFGATPIPANGTTSLTFTIANPAANTVAQTGVAFTDNLPGGLVVATPNGLTSSCGGTTTAAAGSGSVNLSGGTVAVNTSCTISVNVTGTTSGVKNNTTGAVTSTNGGTGNTASASITVASPPTISKAFGAASIPLNASTSLTFNITNPNTIGLTGVAFTDALPVGLVVATPNGLSSTCGGTTTAVAGSGSASLSGGTAAASSSCSISVNVTGTTTGAKNNTTGVVSATESGPGAASNTASLTVNTRTTSTSIAPLSATAAIGQGTNFTVTVTDTDNGPASTPGGSVVVSSSNVTDSIGACALAQTVVGTATCTATVTPAAPTGTHTINASFTAGDSVHANSSTATSAQLTVTNPATTTMVQSSKTPSTYGDLVTFTATVTSVSGTPTGSVTFYDSATCSGTILAGPTSLDISGKAAFSISTLTAPSHTITACYTPTGIYLASNGSVTQTVNQASTTTAITSAATITYNANGSVTVGVTSGAGTVTGNVSLTVDNTTASKALSSGSATFTPADNTALTSPSAGDHTLSASYASQGNFAASGPTSGTLHVNPASTTTAVAALTVIYNANGIVTVTVSSSVGTPAGSASLVVDGGTSLFAALNGGGVATFTLTSPSPGVHTLSASYAAQGNYAASGPTAGMLTVDEVPSITSAASTTFTAAVAGSFTVTTMGFPTPSLSETGTLPNGVTFTDNSNGTATLAGTATVAGSYPLIITAANGVGQAVQMFTLTVNPGPFTKLQLLVPGETTAPGTVNGKTGTPNTEYVNGAFHVTVNAVDDNWNLFNTVTDTVHIASSDVKAILPADAALFAGTGTFSVTLVTPENPAATTITASDVTDNSKVSDTSPAIEVIIVYTASITPTMVATGDSVAYTLTVTNAAAPNTNMLKSVTVAIPTDAQGTPPSSISVTATKPDSSLANWTVDPSMLPGLMRFNASTNNDGIGPSGTIAIQFAATATNAITNATQQNVWLTTAFSDAAYTSALPLAGTQPTVSIGAKPAFASATITNFTVGLAGTFSVTTSGGVPTPTLSESGSLPSGVSFTDNHNGTGTLSGTPAAGTASSYPLTFTAHNGYGADVTQSFTLTVARQDQTITFAALSPKTYGDADFNVSATASSNLIVTFAASGNCTVTLGGAVHITGAGSCAITAHQAGDGTYNPAPDVPQTFSINKVHLTVKADDKTKTYDGAMFSPFTATLSGFVNGETLATSGVTGSAGFTGAATTAVNAGSYTITTTAGTLAATNYDFTTFNNGTLTINKAHLTVTADDKTRGYGDANPTFTFTLSGFKNSETATSAGVTGSPTLSTTATSSVAGSPYTITVADAGTLSAANYDFPATSFVNGHLTITKAHLTVTADNQSRFYGDPNPTFTATLTGFKNGETVATGGVTGIASCTTAAVATSPVNGNPYAITCTQGTLTAGNYDFTPLTDGTLTLNPRLASVTPNSASKTYGDADPAFTGTLTNFVTADGVTATYSRTAGETVAGSPYTISATLAPVGVLGNYTITYNTASFTINVRPITVKAATISRVFGSSTPSFSIFVSVGSLASIDTLASLGTPTFTTSPTNPAINVGSYTIALGSLGNSNYSIGYDKTGTLAITPAPTTTTVISSKNPSFFGGLVMFTATVTNTSTNPAPTGALTITVDGGSPVAATVSGSGNTLTATYSIATLVATSLHTVKATYTNSDGNFGPSGPASLTQTVNPAPTISAVTVTPNSQQYSDPLTFTATLTPDMINGVNPATSVTFFVGTQQITGAPTLVDSSGVLTWTLSNVVLLEPAPFGTAPTGQMAPGNHNVTAVFGNLNPNFSVANPWTSLKIAQEDARVTYAGNLFYGIPQTAPTGTITLIATIQDITAVTGDPVYDPYPGDIRNATLTFVDRATNATLCTASVLLVNSSDTKTGSVTCTFTGVVDNTGSKQYMVGMVVSGYYTRNSSSDNTLVTISQVGPGMITGGGFLVMQNSAGTIAGDPGTHNNFGFNVQYKQSGQNPHGNINSIVRRMEKDGIQHVYQIKGNSMSTLAVYQWVSINSKLQWVAGCTGATSTSPCKAQFNGSANIQDITNPLAPVSVTGNNSLQFNMTDYGSPGSGDTIGITLWNGSGGIWFSTNWVGTPPATVEQLLGGGNLVVH